MGPDKRQEMSDHLEDVNSTTPFHKFGTSSNHPEPPNIGTKLASCGSNFGLLWINPR